MFFLTHHLFIPSVCLCKPMDSKANRFWPKACIRSHLKLPEFLSEVFTKSPWTNKTHTCQSMALQNSVLCVELTFLQYVREQTKNIYFFIWMILSNGDQASFYSTRSASKIKQGLGCAYRYVFIYYVLSWLFIARTQNGQKAYKSYLLQGYRCTGTSESDHFTVKCYSDYRITYKNILYCKRRNTCTTPLEWTWPMQPTLYAFKAIPVDQQQNKHLQNKLPGLQFMSQRDTLDELTWVTVIYEPLWDICLCMHTEYVCLCVCVAKAAGKGVIPFMAYFYGSGDEWGRER